jgi:chlorobactene glucosyltransferase
LIIISYLIISCLILVFTVTLFNACTAPMLTKGPRPIKETFVSVLIPVRNESKNIPSCLEGLLAQDYPKMEICVLDDHSSDETAEIVQMIARQDHRVHYIEGKELPEGWTGKNWACFQLSQYAKGDIFIFTDADNRYTPTAVSKTVGWIHQFGLDLFSAFPQQHTHTLAEKLVIPTVYMTVYCYLPLWLTYYLPFSSLSAANGQWLAFTRKTYRKLGGHKAAKNKIVEDTWLARLAKKQKMTMLTAAGTGEVFGRMYHNRSEIWQGFSKNLFGLMGYRTIPFLFLLLFMVMIYVLPYFMIGCALYFTYALIALILNMGTRLILACKYKDPFITILLHPLAIVYTIIIAVNSMRVNKHGNLNWKGRTILIQ